jgi:hypothetical protein
LAARAAIIGVIGGLAGTAVLLWVVQRHQAARSLTAAPPDWELLAVVGFPWVVLFGGVIGLLAFGVLSLLEYSRRQ